MDFSSREPKKPGREIQAIVLSHDSPPFSNTQTLRTMIMTRPQSLALKIAAEGQSRP
jgi:hypothetical protein